MRPICAGIKTVPGADRHTDTQEHSKIIFCSGNLVESDVVVALLLFNGNVSSCVEACPKYRRSLIKNAAYNGKL